MALWLSSMQISEFTVFVKPGARRPAAGARLVYRNHFDADVGMCVCVCLCVRPPGY